MLEPFYWLWSKASNTDAVTTITRSEERIGTPLRMEKFSCTHIKTIYQIKDKVNLFTVWDDVRTLLEVAAKDDH